MHMAQKHQLNLYNPRNAVRREPSPKPPVTYDFKLLVQIGEGSFGRVFKAVDKISKQFFACKLMSL